jgi:hypothetical protein
MRTCTLTKGSLAPLQKSGKGSAHYARDLLAMLLTGIYTRFLFLCIILSSVLPDRVEAADWEFVPDGRLFRPLLADPGEARFGIFSYLNENRLEGMIGGSWEAFGVTWADAPRPRLRFGLHTGVFTLLRKTGASFPLEAADFLIGLHTDLERGRFTGRLAFAHVSAHLADGYKGPRPAITYSREFFTLYGSYNWPRLRLYGSIRLSNHAIPGVKRWQTQVGGELTSPRLFGRLPRVYAAYDLRIFDDPGAAANHTAQAGLLFHNDRQAGLRLALILHTGRSEHGQFHDLPDRFAGVGIFFDL